MAGIGESRRSEFSSEYSPGERLDWSQADYFTNTS